MILSNNLLDNNEKPQSRSKSITITYRILMSIGFLYVIYCFLSYFYLKQSMDSPLLPEYTTSYIYGHEHALKGLIASVGMFIAQIANWMRWDRASIVILVVIGMCVKFAAWVYVL